MAKKSVEIDKLISSALSFLRERISISEAILFGSHVHGTAREGSDIDLAVFSPEIDEMRLEERAKLATDVRVSCGLRLELHLFPQRALREARPTNFCGYILKVGKKVS